MFNGVDNFENNVDGDDERSEDGISYREGISVQDHEGTSDLEQDNGNIEALETQDADGTSEEAENDNTDALGGFFRLLPYLYLVQRSLGTSSPAILADSGEDGGNIEDSGVHNLYESQRLKSLLHLETLKNQFQASSLRYAFNNFQQCMPPNSNGLEDDENSPDGPTDSNDLFDSALRYEEPLDLTKKNKRTKVETKTREDKIMRPNPRGERGYTIQDLEAALHDIKSGKLGTRRAAVIYGIPRSTLRNKVYKMGKCQSNSPILHPESRIGIHNRIGDKNGNTPKSMYTTTNTLLEDDDDQCDIEINDLSRTTGQTQKVRNHFLDGSDNILRIENSSSNEGPSGSQIETRSNFENRGSKLTFTSSNIEDHIKRGRHSSSSSLHLQNFACVQNPGTSYDRLYGDSSEKKSRPKRGKYRNYDRDALAKAVLAVQNGEMSVHRAGSFFGVPHSTLEYKVKERHLLRQAKFKGNKSATNSVSKSSQPTAGCSSVTSLSPTTQADSNDSTNFPKVIPDLQLSLSQYLNTNKSLGSKWSGSSDLLGLGAFRNAGKDESKMFESFVKSRKAIDESLPKVYDSKSTLNDLLDLTKKT